MKKPIDRSKRLFFLGIFIIAMGVVFSTTLSSQTGALGTVMIAIGSLFFIIAMARRKQDDGTDI
jgi:hypothetical protein